MPVLIINDLRHFYGKKTLFLELSNLLHKKLGLTGEAWAAEWYERVYAYTFAHFPNAESGEWNQRLDRGGRPIFEKIALPVKDPFHLPRALIFALQLFPNESHSGNLATE